MVLFNIMLITTEIVFKIHHCFYTYYTLSVSFNISSFIFKSILLIYSILRHESTTTSKFFYSNYSFKKVYVIEITKIYKVWGGTISIIKPWASRKLYFIIYDIKIGIKIDHKFSYEMVSRWDQFNWVGTMYIYF